MIVSGTMWRLREKFYECATGVLSADERRISVRGAHGTTNRLMLDCFP